MGTLHLAVDAISVYNLWHCAVVPSTAELGSVCKFRGSHIVPDDSADAVCVCGELLTSCDGESVWFEQERERGHAGIRAGIRMGIRADICTDRSCGQVAVVRPGLRPSLCGALVLVATVAAMMTAMATTAAVVMQEVASLRRGDAMAVCDGDKARMYAVDNAGTGTTAEQFARMWAAWALLGPLKYLEGGVGRQRVSSGQRTCVSCLALSGSLARS